MWVKTKRGGGGIKVGPLCNSVGSAGMPKGYSSRQGSIVEHATPFALCPPFLIIRNCKCQKMPTRHSGTSFSFHCRFVWCGRQKLDLFIHFKAAAVTELSNDIYLLTGQSCNTET